MGPKRRLRLAVRNQKELLTLEEVVAIARLLLEGQSRLHETMVETYAILLCGVLGVGQTV